jgi:chemotaxis protein methyltransferase WspC
MLRTGKLMMTHDFERLLREHIGLDVESVGCELVARAVQERQRAAGVADAAEYWQLVTSSTRELQALVEAVVVPETWFFRDPEAFSALAREAAAWLAAQPHGPLRLLSVPCATGEEPYSMALALLDAGLPSARFAIDAIDVSERALAHARAGLYGNNSFRGQLSFRERHFEPGERGFRLRPGRAVAVSFRAGNLLVSETLGSEIYDVVFCRNVLIYLALDARQRALDALLSRLAPGGLLFVGPSETSLLPSAELSPLRVPLAFGFRKARPEAQTRPRPLPERVRAPEIAQQPLAPRATPSAPRAAPVLSPPLAPAVTGSRQGRAFDPNLDAEAQLDQIAMLADRGELREAYRRCTQHERQHGPSARLFHLMGLLCEARRELDDAAALHKKALYLDPHHEQALAHLALLLDKRGDAAAAEQLRRRARRAASKEQP